MSTSSQPASRKKAPAGSNGGFLARLEDFPFQLSRMREEFDRLLERLASEWPSHWERNGWRWRLEIEDQDDSVVIRAEAPGFEAGDFDIQVTDNRLVLSAKKKVETKGEKGETEAREQECYQTLTLPEGISTDKVAAQYHSGVLTVTLPKTEAKKAKRIAVTSA